MNSAFVFFYWTFHGFQLLEDFLGIKFGLFFFILAGEGLRGRRLINRQQDSSLR